MLGDQIFERVKKPEFRPFVLVMANGERIPVRHRDSLHIARTEHKGRYYYSGWMALVESDDDKIIDRTISLSMVAQIIDEMPQNGNNGH